MKVHCPSSFVAVVSYPNGILPFWMCVQYCHPNLENLTHPSNITSKCKLLKCNKASAPPPPKNVRNALHEPFRAPFCHLIPEDAGTPFSFEALTHLIYIFE
jgi:hypothetical protein